MMRSVVWSMWASCGLNQELACGWRGRRELGAETVQEAYDDESGNNACESEAKNVAHMVSGHASSGLVRG